MKRYRSFFITSPNDNKVIIHRKAHSQPAFLLQKDGRVLYFGDRWGGDGESYFTSSYVIYPLGVRDGRLVMDPVDEIML